MPVRKFTLITKAADTGERLDRVLAEWPPKESGVTLSRAEVRRLIAGGAVRLNGRQVRIASKRLVEGARVEIFLDPARAGAGAEGAFEFTPDHIVFEDDWIIVVDKPAGVPTQPTLDPTRSNLFDALVEFLRKRDGGEGYAGLHHRLDRDTSGLLLFTKHRDANRGVASLFADRKIRKTYRAVCVPEQGWISKGEWTVRNYVARIPGKGRRGPRMRTVRSGGQVAETRFRVLEEGPGGVLVEAEPHTGRMHQIRLHLSGEGLPIAGDPAYGGPPGGRVMLHACRLEFPHPVRPEENLVFESPEPPDFRARFSAGRP